MKNKKLLTTLVIAGCLAAANTTTNIYTDKFAQPDLASMGSVGILEGDDSVKVFDFGEIEGLGTVTYVDPDTNRYAAIGHIVTDLINGAIDNDAKVINACDVVHTNEHLDFSHKADEVGSVQAESFAGIVGEIHTFMSTNQETLFEFGQPKIGQAKALLHGVWYDIDIIKTTAKQIDGYDTLFTIKDTTIVQGHSGSPIVQDGKLVGVVSAYIIDSDGSMGAGYSASIVRAQELRLKEGRNETLKEFYVRNNNIIHNRINWIITGATLLACAVIQAQKKIKEKIKQIQTKDNRKEEKAK